MKPAFAVLCLVALAGCSSTGSQSPELSVSQTTKVKCVASNFEPNGCKTSTEFGVAATLTSNEGRLPSAADLRAPGADESEF